MTKTGSTRSTIMFRGLAALIIVLLSHPTAAIVIRHDRDDARYVELGERFPAAVSVLPDGAGVLIAPDWVLTAGHVARGVSRRSPRVRIDGREYEVARIFVHPNWREMGPHDVGVLKLASPVQRVTPAKLYPHDDEVGQVVTFVGRGDTGTGLTGPKAMDGKKRGATNTIVSVDDDWILFNFDEGEAATDLEGVSGPGDSGGPALVMRDGALYTVGISVFSDGRGKGPGRYGVREGYTRVSTHRKWIESIVSGRSTEGEVRIGADGASAQHPGAAIAVPLGGGELVALPDSPVGALVAKYIEVYNSNSDATMSAFISAHFAESYRASKSDGEHLDLYHRLYGEHFGPLTVYQVVRADDAGLTVLFRSEKGPLAEFTFEISPGTPKQIGGLRVGVVQIGGGPD
ncbi:MAG: trypsin-like serine protease [Acidobacteriota bacterium]|nr:trypsin-like serine protease [Acidobacteriota bacterium]MDH3786861.1 trypsin-like serine protease [Acidobacteriota bacterium]